MSGPVFLRELDVSDLSLVEALIALCPDAPQWPKGAWMGALDHAGQSGLVQRRAFGLFGAETALEGLLSATLAGQETELESVLVSPRARRRGVGRQLATAWLSWAVLAGAREAFLEVRCSNVAALALYRGLGFQQQRLRPSYYRDPVEDAVLMHRVLAPKPP